MRVVWRGLVRFLGLGRKAPNVVALLFFLKHLPATSPECVVGASVAA